MISGNDVTRHTVIIINGDLLIMGIMCTAMSGSDESDIIIMTNDN